jgi:hypothetical protein
VIVALGKDDAKSGEPTLDDVRAAAAARGATDVVLDDPQWVARFGIHRRIVPSFRRGRVFLAGDAAHIHSPVGGQGMNIGIQDAYNLAWKLALVVRGEGRPSILDSYEEERRPIAALTLRGTDLATRVVTARTPLGRWTRDALAGALSRIERLRSKAIGGAFELGIHYRRSSLVLDERPTVRSALLVGHAATRARDALDFRAGPRAGDRLPDVEVADGASGPQRLHALLRDPRHVLLLFEGARPAEEVYARFERVLEGVAAAHASRVRAVVIMAKASASDAARFTARGASVLSDADGALHRRFGAAADSVYLVRPDGYIAYRSQHAEAAKLAGYLGHVFV